MHIYCCIQQVRFFEASSDVEGSEFGTVFTVSGHLQHSDVLADLLSIHKN